MSSRHDSNGVGIRKGKGRLMLRARHNQRDGEGDLGSRCEAGDYQSQLGVVQLRKSFRGKEDYFDINKISSVYLSVLYDTSKYSNSDIYQYCSF
jgi:hypothetical protein